MRLGATFLTITAALSIDARAESCRLPCAGEHAPRSGTTIPQNAPFFVGQHAMQRLDRDGWLEEAGMLRPPIRLFATGSLTTNQRLTVRTLDCDDAFIESTFDVGPPAPRPGQLGTLSFVESETPGPPFCDLSVQRGFITLRPTLHAPADLLPWLPLSNLTFRSGLSLLGQTRWGAVSALDDGSIALPEITVACGAPVTLVAEIAGQPTLVLDELEATRCGGCGGCGAGPGGALTTALAAWAFGRRRRANL